MDTQPQDDTYSNLNTPTLDQLPGAPLRIGIEAQHLFKKHKQEADLIALELVRHLQKHDDYNQYFIFVKPEAEVDCLQPSANMKIVPVRGQTSVAWGQVYLPQAVKNTEIDLIHFTGNMASLQCEKPMIATLQDICFLDKTPHNHSPYQKIGWAYQRWMIPETIPKCAKIITNSYHQKDQISQKLSMSSDNIEVVPCGVSPQFRVINPQSYQKLPAQLYPKGFLLYLDSQQPKANIRNVLKGYAQYIQNTVYPHPLVITQTSASQLNNCLTTLNLDWLKEHIVLTGNIARDQMAQWYNQAQALLFPSLHETVGLPILEAMACGTLVIASNKSPIPEITNNCAILVDPHQPAAIAQAINQIHQNKPLVHSLVQQGLEHVAQNRWKYQVERVLNIYKQVVKLTLLR